MCGCVCALGPSLSLLPFPSMCYGDGLWSQRKYTVPRIMQHVSALMLKCLQQMCVCVCVRGCGKTATGKRKQTGNFEQVKWLHRKGRRAGWSREVEKHIRCQIEALLSIFCGAGTQSQDFRRCWLATCQIVQRNTQRSGGASTDNAAASLLAASQYGNLATPR